MRWLARIRDWLTWRRECKRWRGRVLRGRWRHYCNDWDGLPIDETTVEFASCLDLPPEAYDGWVGAFME